MTYRMDSDIPIPYGKIIPKENLTVDEIHMKIRDFGRDNAERYLVRNNSKGKDKECLSVTFLLAQQNSPSGRLVRL